MPKEVEIPGYGTVEFPDSMGDAEINREAMKLYAKGKAGGREKFLTPPEGTTSLRGDSLFQRFLRQAVGALPTAGMMAGGAVGAAGPAAVGQPELSPAGAAFGAGAGGGLGEAVRQLAARGIWGAGPATSGEAAQKMSEQATLGLATEAAGPLLTKIASPVARRIGEAAVKQYSQALGPTKLEMKATTEKVVPKLLERRVRAASRPGLEARATREVETAGEALDVGLANVPASVKVKMQPVLDALNEYKKEFIVRGTGVVANPRAAAQVQRMEDLVRRLGPETSFDSLRSLRQILDKSVQEAKGQRGFALPLNDQTLLAAQKKTADAIRNVLAKERPDIDLLNREFSFWENVQTVIEETNRRTAPQSTPMGEQIMMGAGAGAGLITGGITKAVVYAAALRELRKVSTSTAWRTISAVEKKKLADLMASGRFAEVTTLAARLGSAPRE